MSRAEEIANILKYFKSNPNVSLDPRYVSFITSILEKLGPKFDMPVAAFSKDGRICLQWDNIMYLCIMHYMEEDAEGFPKSPHPNDFDVLLCNFSEDKLWSEVVFSYSEKDKVKYLLDLFEKSIDIKDFARSQWL